MGLTYPIAVLHVFLPVIQRAGLPAMIPDSGRGLPAGIFSWSVSEVYSPGARKSCCAVQPSSGPTALWRYLIMAKRDDPQDPGKKQASNPNKSRSLGRRDFVKLVGGTTVAVSTAGVLGGAGLLAAEAAAASASGNVIGP